MEPRGAGTRVCALRCVCASTAATRPAPNFIVSVSRDDGARPEESRPIRARESGVPDHPLTKRAGSERKNRRASLLSSPLHRLLPFSSPPSPFLWHPSFIFLALFPSRCLLSSLLTTLSFPSASPFPYLLCPFLFLPHFHALASSLLHFGSYLLFACILCFSFLISLSSPSLLSSAAFPPAEKISKRSPTNSDNMQSLYLYGVMWPYIYFYWLYF